MYYINDMRKAMDIVESDVGKSVIATGSVYINGVGNDMDFVVQSSNRLIDKLIKAGYTLDADYPGAKFTSLRKGGINLIVVNTKKELDRWRKATSLCMTIRVQYLGRDMPKAMRIEIFETIKDI